MIGMVGSSRHGALGTVKDLVPHSRELQSRPVDSESNRQCSEHTPSSLTMTSMTRL